MSARRGGFRDWPLSVKVIIALTCALLPLGVLATIVTASAYEQVLRHAGHVSPQRWIGLTLPLLMWLTALLIGWGLANRLLVRPLTRMRALLERYRAGETSIRLGPVGFFSAEMAALAAEFDRMADDGDRHDAAMQGALDEQRRLTREVHHRVKNNLQIVSSLLSIQARETTSDEVARAYITIQARVGALALVHRWMYDDESARGVDLRALATDLCAALEQGIVAAGGAVPRLRCTVDRFFVAQDTAVPLAFLITEIVGLAAQLTSPKSAEVAVTAKAVGGTARLTIAAAVFCDDAMNGTDPAVRIVTGMARQMRAALHHDPGDCSYSIDFAVPRLE